jgi:hypothetical protein
MKRTFTDFLPGLRTSLFLLLLLISTQCADKLSMKEGFQVNELGVCLYFAPGVPEDFQEQFQESLNTYITSFNAAPHAFKLSECKNSSSLQIRVEGVRYTTQDDRATGIALSTLGLVGLPATLIAAGVPMIAWFYYIPQNITLATTAFTADIAHPQLGTLSKTYNTGGIFGNDAKQRVRHAKNFNNHLNLLFTEVERSYKKTSTKNTSITANNKAIKAGNATTN